MTANSLPRIITALSAQQQIEAALRAKARADERERKRATFVLVPETPLPSGWRWHVVQTEARREMTAAEEIDKLGFRPWVPTYRKLVVDRRSPSRKRRKKEVDRPVFASYLLVGFAVDAAWADIAHARGVAGIVMGATHPEPMPETGMVKLLAEAKRNFGIEIQSKFKRGDQVRLTEGPFAFMTGEIDEVDSNLRIIALISAFGRKVRVMTSEEVLELVG